MLQGGSYSLTLRTGYDGLKRFCGIPTLPALPDPLCSYAIRLHACIPCLHLHKTSVAQAACAHRPVFGSPWGKIGMDNSPTRPSSIPARVNHNVPNMCPCIYSPLQLQLPNFNSACLHDAHNSSSVCVRVCVCVSLHDGVCRK